MRVLWITNIVFPEAYQILGGDAKATGSGGWLMSLADGIKDNVDLAIAAPSSRVEQITKVELEGFRFYMFPMGKGNIAYNKEYQAFWKKIKEIENPDLVHLHGTEYSHGLAYMRVFGNNNVVVSIQGVISEIAERYYDGLSPMTILRNITLKDIKGNTIFGDKRRARKRAESEHEILRMAKNVIGRTTFDHAHALTENPSVNYYHCDELMRDTFYNGKWEYNACNPHTIFVSGARYPLKGLHMLLKALPSVMRQYPDVQVRVAGSNKPKGDSIASRMTLTGYQKILWRMMKDLRIEDHVDFLGPLTAERMKEEMLMANLFLSSSSNENSSNALCEAQLLGVPCLASYVGGTPDMIPDKSCGEFYNFFDSSMLAFKIIEMFGAAEKFDNTAMRQYAAKRHSKDVIVSRTLEIYKDITLCRERGQK